jgi:hypothetical protein
MFNLSYARNRTGATIVRELTLPKKRQYRGLETDYQANAHH